MSSIFLLAAGGLQGIADGNGLAVSITGMLIVFAALLGISLFIGFLPMVLARIEPFFPEVEGHHAPTGSSTQPEDENLRLIAVIGYAKHAQAKSSAGAK